MLRARVDVQNFKNYHQLEVLRATSIETQISSLKPVSLYDLYPQLIYLCQVLSQQFTGAQLKILQEVSASHLKAYIIIRGIACIHFQTT